MPSAFDTMFAAVGVPALLAVQGRSATYTPDGGEGVEVTVLVSGASTDDAPRDRDRGRVRVKTLELGVPTTAEGAAETDSKNYVADPEAAASYTLDGETFRLVKVLGFGLLAMVQVASKAAVERTRPNFRR
jgi:hypothetical protein